MEGEQIFSAKFVKNDLPPILGRLLTVISAWVRIDGGINLGFIVEFPLGGGEASIIQREIFIGANFRISGQIPTK